MDEKTAELVKKFGQDNEIYVSATDAQTYWIIDARIPKSNEEGTHHLHQGRRYVTGPNQDGNVLIVPDSRRSDAYLVESWGNLDSFDDFVKKALSRILADREAADKGQGEGCGTSCG